MKWLKAEELSKKLDLDYLCQDFVKNEIVHALMRKNTTGAALFLLEYNMNIIYECTFHMNSF